MLISKHATLKLHYQSHMTRNSMFTKHIFRLATILTMHRRLLMCRVTLGKPVEQYNAIKIAHAPPGHHSVIGRPSTGGLNYPEYAIYRGEQVCECLYVYVHTCVCVCAHNTYLLAVA